MTEQVQKGLNTLAIALVVASIIFAFAVVTAGNAIGNGLSTVSVQGGAVPVALATATPAAIAPTATPTPGKLNLQGAPVEGSASAKVTLVEFSDFQCPFCRRFYLDAYPDVKKNYIDTGKVKLVFMNFPLYSIHPAARVSAQAAVCSNEQNKFWEFHNKIFDEQQKLSPSGATAQYAAAEIKNWTATIPGIDSAKFNSCLDSGRTDATVLAQLQNGNDNGVSGTPSFFVLDAKGGRDEVGGAQPFSVFQAALDKALAA